MLARVVFWRNVDRKRPKNDDPSLPVLIYFAHLKPSGTTPVFTQRQSAMIDLRANITMLARPSRVCSTVF